MRPIFDAHCHIIDSAYPLIPNNGYMPEFFSVDDYQERTRPWASSAGPWSRDLFRVSIRLT